MPKTNKAEIAHIFLYQTFIFENSTSFGTADQDTLVALLSADQAHIQRLLHTPIFCLYRASRFDRREHRVKATVEKMQSLDVCRLETFVLTCPFSRIGSQKLGISSIYAINFGKTEHKQIFGTRSLIASPHSTRVFPNAADKTPRSVVMCLSRIFAFEKWQMLITAMEVYRQLGVDLVVTHVTSAHSSVFQLMKAYEADGLLSIRPSVRFPFDEKEMLYDPNSQTEFTHQLLLAHECFYEFRESAEFIALMDWDDLLLATPHQKLSMVLQEAVRKKPNVAYFLVNKIEGTFVEKDLDDPTKFSVKDQIEHRMLNKFAYNTEKIIARPLFIRGFWMHSSIHLVKGFTKAQLSTDEALIFHMGSQKIEKLDSHYLRSALNLTELESNFQNFYHRPEVVELHSTFPSAQPYLDLIRKCSADITEYFKMSKHMTCLNYFLCDIPQLNVTCTNTVNRFHSQRLGRNLRVHQRIQSSFMENKFGCVV